jgi:hypothetical protein
MTTRTWSGIAAVMFAFLGVIAAQDSTWSYLVGKTGFSGEDGSGWLDLSPIDFSKGDHLVITLGGTATVVVVRLLPKGFDPSRPDVIVAKKMAVRADRTVDVPLTSDYKNIVQVSVHGGPNPWNQFPLGAGNGPATLIRLEYVTPCCLSR